VHEYSTLLDDSSQRKAGWIALWACGSNVGFGQTSSRESCDAAIGSEESPVLRYNLKTMGDVRNAA
jgi:hypothetical protein